MTYYLALLAIITFLLSGCLHTESKPIHFYRLTAEAINYVNQPLLGQINAEKPIIGLGPIRIPEYLDRPQIVTAVTQHQYRLSEDQRWAESLDEDITLALIKALPAQLGTDRIVRYPWSQRLTIDYQIGIDIWEFNVDAHSQSRLTAQYFIKRKDQATFNKHFDCRLPASTTDYDLMVESMSHCLTQLGHDIASTFRQKLLAYPIE